MSMISGKRFHTQHSLSPLSHMLNTLLLTCHRPFYQTDEWRLSVVNKDFSVCPSYPPLVAVPKDVDDDTLRKVATFRHSGRFPVLSYYHKKNGMVSTWEMESVWFFMDIYCVMAEWSICRRGLLLFIWNVYFNRLHFQVMMRAGQPLTGTNGRRCKEDEKLINATLRPGKRGYIIDTRTISVAQQAKARGGGFESEANYPQWRRIHKALERWVVTEGFSGSIAGKSCFLSFF